MTPDPIMDRLVHAHLYATGSFVLAKCTYTLQYSTDLVSFSGTGASLGAYALCWAILCTGDPELRGSLYTAYSLLLNQGRRYFGLESKNQHKKVGGKMRRPKKTN